MNSKAMVICAKHIKAQRKDARYYTEMYGKDEGLSILCENLREGTIPAFEYLLENDTFLLENKKYYNAVTRSLNVLRKLYDDIYNNRIDRVGAICHILDIESIKIETVESQEAYNYIIDKMQFLYGCMHDFFVELDDYIIGSINLNESNHRVHKVIEWFDGNIELIDEIIANAKVDDVKTSIFIKDLKSLRKICNTDGRRAIKQVIKMSSEDALLTYNYIKELILNYINFYADFE